MPLQSFGTLKANFWLVMAAVRQGKLKKHHFKTLRDFASNLDAAIKKDCPNNAAKASHVLGMWDKFRRIQNKLKVPATLTNPLVRKTLQDQIQAINMLKDPTRLNVNMRAEAFNDMIKILKAVTDSAFIDALEKDPGLPKFLLDMSKFAPIGLNLSADLHKLLVDLSKINTDMISANMVFPDIIDPAKQAADPMSLQAIDSNAPHSKANRDPMHLIDLDFTEQKKELSDAIVYIVGKEAAKVSVKRAKTIITANGVNFTKSVSRAKFMQAVYEKIENTTIKTEMHSAHKHSQYASNPELQNQHNKSKKLLFKKSMVSDAARYDIKHDAAAGRHVILNADNMHAVVELRVYESPRTKEVERVELIDTGNYSELEGFSVSGLIIAELGVMAKELGATSVTISSNKRDGTVNVNNVLRAAFTALHKDLLPKFDETTWRAIKAHLDNNAVAYNAANNASKDDKFTSMLTSGDFAAFLLKYKLTGNATIKSEDLRSDFTGLLQRLKYRDEYINLRSKI